MPLLSRWVPGLMPWHLDEMTFREVDRYLRYARDCEEREARSQQQHREMVDLEQQLGGV